MYKHLFLPRNQMERLKITSLVPSKIGGNVNGHLSQKFLCSDFYVVSTEKCIEDIHID